MENCQCVACLKLMDERCPRNEENEISVNDRISVQNSDANLAIEPLEVLLRIQDLKCDTEHFQKMLFGFVFCLFVLGFNVSLTLFQSYCDGNGGMCVSVCV